jgi:hypothetical protein
MMSHAVHCAAPFDCFISEAAERHAVLVGCASAKAKRVAFCFPSLGALSKQHVRRLAKAERWRTDPSDSRAGHRAAVSVCCHKRTHTFVQVRVSAMQAARLRSRCVRGATSPAERGQTDSRCCGWRRGANRTATGWSREEMQSCEDQTWRRWRWRARGCGAHEQVR